MKNFKEIAEKCLAGELSGTFVTVFGNNWHSNYLQRHTILGQEIPEQYILGPGVIYNEIGQCKGREEVRIIDFIPDNIQKKIEIDVPEGKVPVMEQTENGVVITWKEKELTYTKLLNEFGNNLNCIHTSFVNSASQVFYKKVTVLRKLTNIRNYFGKPDKHTGWCIIYRIADNCIVVTEEHEKNPYRVVFAKKEHAEQAIKMLGDELKLLFEPW
jgi:hypothetical protein